MLRRHLVAENSVNHCTWRAHNHLPALRTVAGKRYFLSLLAEYKDRYGIEIHSYALMDTHPHVQTRSRLGQAAFSAFWKIVNYRFARWANRLHGRVGQVVMQRMASPQIQSGRHQLAVMRYGDMNPVRAGMVRSPKQWAWSSYRHYAFGEKNPLITDSPEYVALGVNGAQRRRAYVHLFAYSRLPGEESASSRDLVFAAFVGDLAWVVQKRCACGLGPAG